MLAYVSWEPGEDVMFCLSSKSLPKTGIQREINIVQIISQFPTCSSHMPYARSCSPTLAGDRRRPRLSTCRKGRRALMPSGEILEERARLAEEHSQPVCLKSWRQQQQKIGGKGEEEEGKRERRREKKRRFRFL